MPARSHDDHHDHDDQRHDHRLERMSYAERGRFFPLRNVLNTVFVLLAIVGMALYFYKSHTVGGMLLIAGVIIKVVECALRIIR